MRRKNEERGGREMRMIKKTMNGERGERMRKEKEEKEEK